MKGFRSSPFVAFAVVASVLFAYAFGQQRSTAGAAEREVLEPRATIDYSGREAGAPPSIQSTLQTLRDDVTAK